jgi:hypothetical protein
MNSFNFCFLFHKKFNISNLKGKTIPKVLSLTPVFGKTILWESQFKLKYFKYSFCKEHELIRAFFH